MGRDILVPVVETSECPFRPVIGGIGNRIAKRAQAVRYLVRFRAGYTSSRPGRHGRIHLGGLGSPSNGRQGGLLVATGASCVTETLLWGKLRPVLAS